MPYTVAWRIPPMNGRTAIAKRTRPKRSIGMMLVAHSRSVSPISLKASLNERSPAEKSIK
jgi:hypothetical protein